ncbi:MAG: hypothetical protein ACXV3F_04220 [Frankiaceae bacterium]
MEIQRDVACPSSDDEGLGLIEELLVEEPETVPPGPLAGRDTQAGERR